VPRPKPPVPPRAPILVVVLACLLVALTAACTNSSGQGDVDVRIGSSEPLTWDPARSGDAGTASVHAQVYEGLTAFDSDSNVQPALASSWEADESGRRITFELRPGATYSDGTPVAAQDVVESWLRLIDPASPSPLASLLDDVVGAADYRGGAVGRDAVGLAADGNRVVVDLRRPATYFLAVTASPTLAVVAPSTFDDLASGPPAVVSGAYVPTVAAPGTIRLSGNSRYWAGMPALDQIELLTDFGGTSGVQMFTEGRVDYTGVGVGDATWLEWDQTLGPQLRQTDSFTVSYYGFNTTVAPFDDATVRLAFAKAVDWQRMTTLAEDVPATSMIPPGIPGHDGLDHRPEYDPEEARALLEQAGFPGGEGFPVITLATYGVGYEDTVRQELEQNLGIDVNVEALDFEPYLEIVADNTTPTMWTLSWVADYPHAHDFLGLLLETGSASNTGQWSNADYDSLIEQAAATDDPEEQAAIYSRAQDILTAEAPVIPLSYGGSFALSREGLMGALSAGVGFIRYASLDWTEGTGS
jgi:ABC-type oligopeptide transport system substrate-binding subunit